MTDILDKSSLKALGSETRQEILKMLSKRPYTASELSRLLGKHVTTIAEHMGTLESSGLVLKKEGSSKWIYYTLTPKGEKMFRPQYYSWTLLLALSMVSVVAGFGRIFAGEYGAASRMMESAKDAAPLASVPVAVSYDFSLLITAALIVAGLIGLAVAVRKMRIA